LDIDGFICNNRTASKLKRSLSELDGRWRKLFDHAVGLSKQVSGLTDNLCKSEALANNLKFVNDELSEKVHAEHSLAAALKSENAYLRKMIREYLYPSLANAILQSECEDRTSGANKAAIDAMTDGDIPSSFRKSVAYDHNLRSREDNLLGKLRLLAQEDDCDG
jgi:hypothetical protein